MLIVENIAKAFLSRAHVSLLVPSGAPGGYKQIRDVLFETLKSQRADVCVESEAMGYAKDCSERQNLGWDGRQIHSDI